MSSSLFVNTLRRCGIFIDIPPTGNVLLFIYLALSISDVICDQRVMVPS